MQAAESWKRLKADVETENAALGTAGLRLTEAREQEKAARSKVDESRGGVRASEAAVTKADEACPGIAAYWGPQSVRPDSVISRDDTKTPRLPKIFNARPSSRARLGSLCSRSTPWMACYARRLRASGIDELVRDVEFLEALDD